MHQISNETFRFLKDCWEYHVHELLDDPEGYSSLGFGWEEKHGPQPQIKACVDQLETIGKDIGRNFWATAKRLGTDYEVRQLQQMVGGF